MSNDAHSFVKKYADPPGDDSDEPQAPAKVHPISGEVECFGIAKANRMAPAMLVLKQKNGNQKALMYSYLVEINFDPSEGIVMKYVSHSVTIKGRHLGAIFERLVEHRISWMQEVEESAIVDETATAVSGIEIAEA
ncbi:MAG: hypothetical protein DHS20C21_20550 [Gemmatimonadota bacterium]|nr:MAG: hypothetical protein DHS20C21_20550 [Gemmatimonadota bacterium]